MEEVSNEAAKLAHDPDFTLWHPENHDGVVEKLNDGIFHQLLQNFIKRNWNHGIVYLGALTMLLGANISEEDMQMLRDTLETTPMYDEAKAQMVKGLEGYKNEGSPWDFNSPGLHDKMAREGLVMQLWEMVMLSCFLYLLTISATHADVPCGDRRDDDQCPARLVEDA